MRKKRFGGQLMLALSILVIAAVVVSLIVVNITGEHLTVTLVGNSQERGAFVTERLSVPDDTDQSGYAAFLAETLFSGTFSSGYFPASSVADVLGITVQNGVAHINLSSAYSELSAVDMSLSDCCLVSTLCSLYDIDSVVITVGYLPHPVHGTEPITSELFETSLDPFFPELTSVRFYLPDLDSGGLTLCTREVETYSARTDYLYFYTFSALFATDGDKDPIFPKGTEYISSYTEGSAAHITVSHHLLTFKGGLDESILLLRSIVYTATEYGKTDQVYLHLKDRWGSEKKQFNGISLEQPFSRTTDYSSLVVSK